MARYDNFDTISRFSMDMLQLFDYDISFMYSYITAGSYFDNMTYEYLFNVMLFL